MVLLIGPSVRSLARNRVVFWFLPKPWRLRIASELEYVISFVFVCVCIFDEGFYPGPYPGTVIPGYGNAFVWLLFYANSNFICAGEVFDLNRHALPFLFFYFHCDSEFSTPGPRIENYFVCPARYRLLCKQL